MKKIGTIITLTYEKGTKIASTNDLIPLFKSIESKISIKEGLKILVSTSCGKSNRTHHHILINKVIELNIKDEWKNGLSSIDYIEDKGHYRKVIKYLMS